MTSDEIRAVLLSRLTACPNGATRSLLTKRMARVHITTADYVPVLNRLIDSGHVAKVVISPSRSKSTVIYHVNDSRDLDLIEEPCSEPNEVPARMDGKSIFARTRSIITRAMIDVHVRHVANQLKNEVFERMREKPRPEDQRRRRRRHRGPLKGTIKMYDQVWERISGGRTPS